VIHPDPSDRASELEDLARQDALVVSRRAEPPKVGGSCLYCSERLAASMRFCGPDCRNAYDEHQELLRRRGKGKS
jgi:hypothetical protein